VGELVALIGSNGAGKTTTLRAISGLLRPSAGSIAFDGSPIAGRKPNELVRLGIAHAPEGRRIFARMTVRENIELGAYLRPKGAAVGDDLAHVCTTFPRLRERLDQSAGTLSGGEQQMLALARAIMSRPRLLLLDEPSLGLSPLVVRTIFSAIAELNATGTSIILVEQNARQALRVAARGYVLERGRIVEEGTAEALAESPTVRAAYLGA